MHWNETAIILSVRKHGENSAVLRVLAHQQGVFSGIAKGVSSKSNRGIFQPGNIVNATWQARLSEHLGTFKCELLEANTAFFMQDNGRLSALSAACALVESALPERHPYERLYALFLLFLHALKHEEGWLKSYVLLELDILAEAGFGLDLSECAATGSTQDLIYVSPKSGRAVSRIAGEPYKNKLFPLPAFLLRTDKKNDPNPAEILAGLDITGYFLDHWLLTPHHRKLPAVRERLIEMVKKTYGSEITKT